MDMKTHYDTGYSECQHDTILECKRAILESLSHQQGGKESEIFTRAFSALIPRLLSTSREPEWIWTSNFTHSLRCTMWTMLPVALRSTPVTKARAELRCTMEALAKGCHKLWGPQIIGKSATVVHVKY